MSLCFSTKTLEVRYQNFLGYLVGISSGFLPSEIVDTFLVNVGDWRGNKSLWPSTHTYELEATNYLKEIFQFPDNKKDWGNSCTGSSEAILAAVIYGRTALKEKTGKNPVVITSQESHYCHRKSALIAGLEYVVVSTEAKAGMDTSRIFSCVCHACPARQ
jgi:glutamate/tyrosine decarboxylase-like PLP-dependent enzyme